MFPPSPATKEPFSATCVEAAAHPLPTLSARYKEKEKKDRKDLKRSQSSDLFQRHIMVLNDSNDISREALKYESS